MAKTPHFHCGGIGSIPDWGTKISYARQHGKKQPLPIYLSPSKTEQNWTQLSKTIISGLWKLTKCK